MAVVFDASVLIDLFGTKRDDDRRAALDHLIASLAKARTRVLIPTPALAEFLVRAGKARERYLLEIGGSSAFSIEPFDQRAAIECALLLEDAWGRGLHRKVATRSSSSIGRLSRLPHRAMQLQSSDDSDISKAAERVHIPVHRIDALPIPSSTSQQRFPFDKSNDETDSP